MKSSNKIVIAIVIMVAMVFFSSRLLGSSVSQPQANARTLPMLFTLLFGDDDEVVNDVLVVADGAVNTSLNVLDNDTLSIAATLLSIGGPNEINASDNGTGVTFGTISGAQVSLAADGQLSYDATALSAATPGTDTLYYVVLVGGNQLVGQISIDFGEPPVAQDDPNYEAFVPDDLTVEGDNALVGNDSFGDSDSLVTSFGGGDLGGAVTDNATNSSVPFAALGGELQVNSDGSFFITGQPYTEGSHTFEYRLTNVYGTSDATVTITVVSYPTAVDDAATINEDAPATTIDVLNNDDDVSSGVSITSVTQPANGSVVITNNGADLQYDSDLNYCNDGSPTDDFTYTVSPGGSIATVAVSVTCADDPPQANNDTALTDEDSPTTINVTQNDLEVDGDSVSVIATGGSPLGSVSIVANNIQYDPNGQFESLLAGSTTDTFTYTIEDTPGNVSAASVTVTITGLNDSPQITLPSATATYVEGDDPRIIDPSATLTDIDSPNFNGGVLNVALTANATADDRLSINSQVPPNPSGTGLEISGSTILFNGVEVGNFSGGTNGSTPLVVNFTAAAATLSVVQTVLRNITFEDQGEPATFNTRTVSASVSDGDGGTSASVNQNVQVEAPSQCDGTVFSNFCWWLGNNNESCTAVCSDHGGVNANGTANFAGSGGSNTNCGNVMSALNLDTGNPPNPTPVSNAAGALGCASDFGGSAFTVRYTSATDAGATGSDIRRACACNDQPAPVSIEYPSAPYSLPRGVEITNIAPNVSGFVASYAISPGLPAGLSFNPATGVISGTPTTVTSNASYTVTATNAGGTVTDTFTLGVAAQPPASLSYSGAPFLFNLNNMVTPQLPTFVGQVDTFSVMPALPVGLSFNTSTGEISGTPTVTQAATNHTVTATNVDGMGSVVISVEVTNSIACDGTAFAGFCWYLGNNTQSCDTTCSGRGGNNAAGTTTFAGSGGSNANCGDVMTALNQDTGSPPSPTPVVNQTGTLGCGSDFSDSAFTIRYTSATSASATGTNIRRACACNDQPAPVDVAYSNAPFTFTQGVAITTQTPTVTNAVASWGISPALPAGLSFSTTTGAISGTPTALQSATNHTVTASNAGGSAMEVISVAVQAQPPMNLDYAGSPFVFNVGTPISPTQFPTVTGTVNSYSISPALPAGITFSTGTGAIAGTPTATSATASYTVTATNSAGNDTDVISVTVNGPVTCDAGATIVGGHCWYFGSNNQSCDTVCSTHGGYSSATQTYAGSDGSDGNCDAVLIALGQTQPSCSGPENRTGLAVGCGVDYEASDACITSGSRRYVRYTSPDTSGSGSSASSSLYIRRACACNN